MTNIHRQLITCKILTKVMFLAYYHIKQLNSTNQTGHGRYWTHYYLTYMYAVKLCSHVSIK